MFSHQIFNIHESKASFPVLFRIRYLFKHCVSPSPSMGSAVTQSETHRTVSAAPTASGPPESSLTTRTSSWFEMTDKIAVKSGKFGKAQLCFDINCWFKMPKHRESKATKIRELQCDCCQGKCKRGVCKLRLQ